MKFGRNNDPPMVRTPGLGHIRRNDIIAFNFPYRYRWDTARMNLDKIFVKRCIGLPGDSLSVAGGYYRIAGLPDTVGNAFRRYFGSTAMQKFACVNAPVGINEYEFLHRQHVFALDPKKLR